MRNQKPITLTESRLRQIIKEELSAARRVRRARSLREGLDFQTEEEWQDFLDQQLNHAPGAVYAEYVRDYQAWKKSQGLAESRPKWMGPDLTADPLELKIDRKGMEADDRTMQKLEDFCRDYRDLCGSFGTASIEAALQLTLGLLDARSLLEDMDLASGEFAHVVKRGEAGVKDWADSIVSNLAEYSEDLLVVGPFGRGHVRIRDIASKGAAAF